MSNMSIEQKNNLYLLFETIVKEVGISILEIDGQYFSTVSFEPSDRNTPYCKLQGKNITSIISTLQSTGLAHRAEELKQKISLMENVNVRFSSDYTWKWFTN